MAALPKRNVVVLGKTGCGKSSVANNIAGGDVFEVSDSVAGVTRKTEMTETLLSYGPTEEYTLRLIDTVGLFDHELKAKEIFKDVKDFFKTKVPEGIHLILFVFKDGRFTPEERKTFKYIMENFKGREVSDISALVLTHCENKSQAAREKCVSDFTKHELTRDIAKFMGKGLFCVGFPQLDTVEDDLREIYERKAMKDVEKLHKLITDSDDLRLSKKFLEDSFWKKCTIL